MMSKRYQSPEMSVAYELDLFARAQNWKTYWAKSIAKYLRGSVAEVGAGIGSNARFLLNQHVEKLMLIEPGEELFSQLSAREYPEYISKLNGTLRDSQCDFDTIVYIDVLEHINNDLLETSCAYDHLTKGGHLVILSPAWPFLYSPFDRAVGHYRRYTRASLRASVDSRLETVSEIYLDSVGLLASLANKLLLRTSSPSDAQVKLWDGLMVRMSAMLDPMLCYTAGKTVVGVYRKPEF
ncbi:class I SAM-dependent methyltransferase [Arenicellales bacterium nBUS_45]